MGLYRQQSAADMPIIQFFGIANEKKQKTNEAWPYGESASFASGMTATDCNGASQPKHFATWVLPSRERSARSVHKIKPSEKAA
jgi:hypothetical protein